MAKADLAAARNAKQDEFYTQLDDIAKELKYYTQYFQGKVVLCNCDDPYESNFFKYFALNFNRLGLKKLIATCYNGSPIAGDELPLLFEIEETEPKKIVEEEVEKDGKKVKVKKAVFDDSYTPITEDEYKKIIKSRHHTK